MAHYTSITALEKILKSEEVWFSNPLFMNDLEEVRFGFHRGKEIFEQSDVVRQSCNTPGRYHALRHYFNHYYDDFEQKHALDVYVFCLSEHDPEDKDGRLSMWRAYGVQGNGAALVFNTRYFGANPDSQLLIAKVRYGSPQQRIEEMTSKINRLCNVLQTNQIPDEKLHIIAFSIFMLRLIP